ncbi:MAG: hypothetical protein WAN65_04690 [Candidatus Sulfotelmatobacter sp.]
MTIPDKNQNKGSVAARRDRRRTEVAQDLKDGFTVRESAKNLGVSKDTIVNDRKAIIGRFQSQADETVQEYRAEVLLKLADIEALVSDPSVGKIDKAKVLLDVVKQLRSIYGTDSPTKSISASFSANADPHYLDFKKVAAGLDDDQLAEVFRFAASLPRMSEPIDAAWFPQPDNKEEE